MDADRISSLLQAGVILAIVAGIALIIRAGPILTGVGVLLVIAGLIGLMPALHFQLESSQPTSQEGEA